MLQLHMLTKHKHTWGDIARWMRWVAAAIAYGPGVFFGLVIGYIFTSHNHEWFTETLVEENTESLLLLV